jgi:tight adherence protein C
MSRLAVAFALLAGLGATLALSELRWFRRPSLVHRLRSYAPVPLDPARSRLVSVGSFREVIGPLSRQTGDRLAHLFGVQEDLARRLARLHLDPDPARFRSRQVLGAAAAGGAGLVVAVGADLGGAMGLVCATASALLVFLLVEQRLAERSARRQAQILAELPVVTEQLAMLLGAGFSLGSALQRLAHRGSGAVAADLTAVVRRTRQGLHERAALREWAEVMDIPALHRLVRVLALEEEAADLGRLVAAEALSMRRDAHRRLIETIERRSQQVWIPVTVAALVPGVLFLAVPFIDALSLIAGS